MSAERSEVREMEPCYLGALPPELVDKIFSEVDSVRDQGNFTTCRFIHAGLLAKKGIDYLPRPPE